MDFDHPEWQTMHGGYRVPYDPRNALLALERDEKAEAAWSELWGELFHQGDVGEVSCCLAPCSHSRRSGASGLEHLRVSRQY